MFTPQGFGRSKMPASVPLPASAPAGATAKSCSWGPMPPSQPARLAPQQSKGAALISDESVKRRLSRSHSYRSLVVESSSDAHVVLHEFATTPKPEWHMWNAVSYVVVRVMGLRRMATLARR